MKDVLLEDSVINIATILGFSEKKIAEILYFALKDDIIENTSEYEALEDMYWEFFK